jgi:hypothetical protein
MTSNLIREFKNEISYLKINANGLVVVDINNAVYFFDENFKLKNAFKIKLPPNKPYENSVCVSDDFQYLLLAVEKKPLTLWDIKEKKLLGKYEWHKGDVLSVEFGKNYFASGGIDGKIFLYSLELLKMVSKLARHKDFISDIAFGEGEIYAGGYDKSVIFVDEYSLKKEVRYLHLKKVVKVENGDFLVSASEYSDVIKWDADKKERKDRLDLYTEFKDFCIYEGYIFIALKNRVVLYDLQKEILVNEKFLDYGVSKIAAYDDKLIIVKNGVLEYLNLTDEKELLDFVLKNDYKSAYEKVLFNPFLKKTKTYEKLELLYKNSLKKAVKYLENGLKSEAFEVLKPFMEVLEKREEISKTLSHFENIIKFKKAYEKRNFALFYQIAKQYDLLKNTKYYRLVEKEWEIKFEKAKRAVFEGNVEAAKEILKDFMSVSEKIPLIELLLKKGEIFKLLREKLAKKDFRGFFALVKANPELKDTREYKAVMEYAQKLYDKALTALEEENFKYVMKIAEILEDIEGYELKAKDLLEKAKISLDFLRLFNEDKNKAFELVEKYPFLKNLKAYRLYEERWARKLSEAEKKAFKGKIKSALEELKEYEGIGVKRPRIKNMLKSAYLNYIKESKDEKAIEKYIKTFGKDEEVVRLMK